jgi:hypothetical protein
MHTDPLKQSACQRRKLTEAAGRHAFRRRLFGDCNDQTSIDVSLVGKSDERLAWSSIESWPDPQLRGKSARTNRRRPHQARPMQPLKPARTSGPRIRFLPMSTGRNNRSDRSAETNARVLILALIAVVAAILLFLIAEHDAWFKNLQWLQATMEQVAGLIVATGLLSAGWELVGKRRFAAEVLEKAKLSSDVTDSGLKRVTDQYLEDVEWAELFAGATQLDVVVAYARTWRNNHAERLRSLAAMSGGRLRVFLPDPDDGPTMAILADRFNMTPARIAETVNEAIDEYSALDRPGGGSVEVWVRSGDVVYSCYRFDHRAAVLTLYSHSKERRTSVPTLVVGRGRLFRFVSEELEAIEKQSRPVYPEPAAEG